MVYAVVGLSVAFLGVTLGLALWVSKLKDREQEWMTKHALVSAVLHDTQLQVASLATEKNRLEVQRQEAIRAFKELSDAVENSSSDDAAGVAERLRGLLP